MNLKKKYAYTTNNPLTRRCIKCGAELPREHFLVPESPDQARVHNRGTKEVAGIQLADGSFLRGYTRNTKRKALTPHLIMGFKCPSCRKATPKTRHPKRGKTFQEVMRQLREAGVRAHEGRRRYFRNDDGQLPAITAYYHAYYAMIRRAKSLAYERGRKGGKCPDRWEKLLTEGERSELYALHARVVWHSKTPPVY